MGKKQLKRKNRYEQLNTIPMNADEAANDNQAKMTEAEKDFMNSKLEGIAGAIESLVEKMTTQLEKEDNYRKRLINFFIGFTIAITLVPLIIVGIFFGVSHGHVEMAGNIALVSAIINVPVSTIGVLKCIAKSLFNDTYRRTLPEMITKITDALSNYNTIYRRQRDNKDG